MDIIQDIEWSIEMIGSNKLYEPVIGGDVNEEVKKFKLFSKKKG